MPTQIQLKPVKPVEIEPEGAVQIGQCAIDVHHLDDCVDPPADRRRLERRPDQKWDAGAKFEVGVLGPAGLLAELITMVPVEPSFRSQNITKLTTPTSTKTTSHIHKTDVPMARRSHPEE